MDRTRRRVRITNLFISLVVILLCIKLANVQFRKRKMTMKKKMMKMETRPRER